MWGLPMFDLRDAAGVLIELTECRKAYGDRYIRLSRHSIPAMAGNRCGISFIVNRPKEEPGFRLERQEVDGRNIRYTTKSYAVDRPGPALRWVVSTLTVVDSAGDASPTTQVDLRREFDEVGIGEVLDQLDRELIGLKPVKTRIREIASLLLIERIRKRMDLASGNPTLHMSFTGNPGTGKTTVALRIASILHKLAIVRRGQVVSVTRDELVGQYIGHTAPKTKEILKKAMGGVLFIDEAYYLHRPDNERDYGQEAIEILLQVMETSARIWW
jgi:hypothetical protein